MEQKKMELLAPGGDVDSIKAAIIAGADAVYCGLDKFNARNRAANISFEDLQGVLHLAHKYSCEIFLTINIIIVENEIPAFVTLMNRLVNTSIDGVIVQDIGMFYLLQRYFPTLNVHASTQCTTHNAGQIAFLKKLGATRVNLSRELNLTEIKELTDRAHENNMLTEVFVHGSNCISFSGLCYISSLYGGNSGNRGRCSQPCRDEYQQTAGGNRYPLNLKDNSAFSDLPQLAAAGVDSLKIEGRIKKHHYVYKVVDTWRRQLDRFYKTTEVSEDKSELFTVFNRDFSNSFLKGNISRDMFIDNPRDNSAVHYASKKCEAADPIENAKRAVYDIRTKLIDSVNEKLSSVTAEKIPLNIDVSGEPGEPLKISCSGDEISFALYSESVLKKKDKEMDFNHFSESSLRKRFKTVNESEYVISSVKVSVSPDLYLPVKELNLLKKSLLHNVYGSTEIHPPVELPKISHNRKEGKQKLSILISSAEAIPVDVDCDIFYEMPSAIGDNYHALIDLFRAHPGISPWFPSVIIGEEFSTAVQFLRELSPKKIVTNNTGIAHEAYLIGIEWIAGPYINCVNSYTLIALQEKFNCAGAFISNEINQMQLAKIKRPRGFKLYYSIYHPIVLMTSRQCFFHPVSGCEKISLDKSCIPHCERTDSIKSLNNKVIEIEKRKGHYHALYSDTAYLNSTVVNDFPHHFSNYLIDLRRVSEAHLSGNELIELFQSFLLGSVSANELKDRVAPTTAVQYKKGI